MSNRPSSISQLPEEVREKITTLRDQGRTIKEILEALDKAFDVNVSKSALHRHLQKQGRVADNLRKSRELAKAIGRSFGDSETSDVARMNVEILHDLIMRGMIGGDDQEEQTAFDPKDLMFLATALEKAAKAQKADFETQLKAALEQERRATVTKAAESAVTTARRQGLSAETVNAIKSSILGVGA